MVIFSKKKLGPLGGGNPKRGGRGGVDPQTRVGGMTGKTGRCQNIKEVFSKQRKRGFIDAGGGGKSQRVVVQNGGAWEGEGKFPVGKTGED